MEIVSTMFDTTVQCAGIGCLAKICRHKHTFPHNIFHTNFYRIHMKLLCQFIDRGLQCEYSLGRTVTTVRTCRLHIGVDHITGEPGCLTTTCIERNCFMA